MIIPLEYWHCKRLVKTPLFSHLNEEGFVSVIKNMPTQMHSYPKGSIIAHQNTECTRLTILVDGQLNASMIDHDGKKVTVEYLDAPRLVAPGFIYGTSPRYPVDIEASTDIVVFQLPKKAFTSLLINDPQTLQAFLNLISNRAQFLSSRIMYLSSRSIEEKVVQYLRDQFTKQDSATITLPISITEMSALFAVTRPALSRVLRKMQEKAIFEKSGRKLILKDKRLFNDNKKGRE